jgi:hypothetical protein
MMQFKKISREEISKHDCIRGHMGFGFHKYFKGKIEYITVLREPVERVISFYYYILRTPDHYLYNVLNNSKMTFDEFVDSKLTHEIYNGQLRLIASQDGLGTNFETKKEMDDTDLERAKTILKTHFAAVGTLDKFDLFLQLLQKIFHWSDITYTRRNVTESKLRSEDIHSKTLNKIININQPDIKLYDFAKLLFTQKLTEYNIVN